MKSGVLLVICAATIAATPAAAAPAQLQADLGLAVIGAGYEQPVGEHVGVMAEAQIVGTYFLPWFDAGDDVIGVGGEVRASWFRDARHRGLYAAGTFRVDRVADDTTHAVGWCAGLLAGYAFGATDKLDVRVGAGAQWMHYQSSTIDIDTPFVTIDLVVGWRLGS